MNEGGSDDQHTLELNEDMQFELGMGQAAVPNSSDEEDGFNLFSQSERINGQNLNAKPRRRRRRKNEVIFRSHRPGDPVSGPAPRIKKNDLPELSLARTGTDLNSFGSEVKNLMKERLQWARLTEYSLVVQTLNKELCEPKLHIVLEIDTLPDIDWRDGSMTMVLKCVRHLRTYVPVRLEAAIRRRNRRRRERRAALKAKEKGDGFFESTKKSTGIDSDSGDDNKEGENEED